MSTETQNIPLLSVIMPVFNGARFLGEAIESILAQTFSDYEFIILDDGSTDSSLEIIDRYSDKRIRLYKREHLGYVTQLNYGLFIAKSEIIARMDADDISLPERFYLQYHYLKENPTVGVVSSSFQLIDQYGTRGAIKWLPAGDEQIRNMIPVFCPLSHGASMFRRTVVLTHGGYDERYFPNEDYELWLRLSRVTTFGNIVSPQLFVRKYEGTITQKYGGSADRQRLGIALEYIDRSLESQTTHAQKVFLELQKARCHYYYGELRSARRILFRLIWKDPTSIVLWRYYLPTLLGNLLFGWLRSSGFAERLSNIFRSKPHSTLYIRP
jgi:glycosyltransferase involved in cell wall biosynthesis